ncbi:MAG TPA: substrate-binding domain-containing protein [Candidatus Dorea intestinavium]|nr:substrate-binding domain-containing protein [Candidatus Dorea intestinavium]
MKKKVISALLCVALVGTMLVGCGKKDGGDDASKESKEATSGDKLNIEIVSKGFQHQYWQAVLKGAEQKAKELGATINFVGPNSESDIADQVQMFQSAINQKPAALGLAALDTEALLDSISQAQAAGIPIVGFDSGVPGAPEGSIVANASTDNYAAGEVAAEEGYKAALKDRIAKADGPVRIGVMGQDATAESIVNRGLGFIDKLAELVEADGKTVSVTGNDKYVADSKVEDKNSEKGDVIIEVVVPSQVTNELSAVDCQTLLNKDDTICIYGSNQHSGEAMITGNENLKKFGTGDDKVIGITFDSGANIKAAVADGTFLGAVTQAPVHMGETVVDLCVKAAKGEEVSDVDTGSQWYTKDNMDDPEIAQNLYD